MGWQGALAEGMAWEELSAKVNPGKQRGKEPHDGKHPPTKHKNGVACRTEKKSSRRSSSSVPQDTGGQRRLTAWLLGLGVPRSVDRPRGMSGGRDAMGMPQGRPQSYGLC